MLIRALNLFLSRVQSRSHVAGFVRKTFSRSKEPIGHRVFESAINLLLSTRRYNEATSVLEGMLKEGYLPSMKTESKFLAVSLAGTDPSREAYDKVWTHLQPLFASPTFTESDLLEVCSLVRTLQNAPRTCLALISMYVASREAGYTASTQLVCLAINMQVRLGMREEVQETLAQFDLTAAPSRATHPFASAISAMADIDPFDDDSVDRALDMVRQREIRVDNSLYNALIKREIAKAHHHAGPLKEKRAWALYRSLIELHKNFSTLRPDFYTFNGMWNLLIKSYTRRRKGGRNAYRTYRELFRDMLAIYFSPDNPTYHRDLPVDRLRDRALLNVALKNFLVTRDYPGAFIVVKAFDMLHVPVGARTYLLILKHILWRIYWNVRLLNKRARLTSSWGARFIGFQEGSSKVQMGRPLMYHLLTLNASLGPDREKFGHRRKYHVPSVEMMNLQAAAPLGTVGREGFSVVPLQRLLKRAAVANFEMKTRKNLEHKDAVLRVSEMIRTAKVEMISTERRKARKSGWIQPYVQET